MLPKKKTLNKIRVEYVYTALNQSNRGYNVAPPITMEELERLEDNRRKVKVDDLHGFFRNKKAFSIFKRNLINEYTTSKSSRRSRSSSSRRSRSSSSRRSRSSSTRKSRSLSPRRFSSRPAKVSSNSDSPGSSRSSSPSRASSPGRNRGRGRRGRGRGKGNRERGGRGRKRNRYKMLTKLGKILDDEAIAANGSVLDIISSGDECDETDVNLPMSVCRGIQKVCRNYNAQRQYIPYSPDNSENKRYKFHVKYRNP